MLPTCSAVPMLSDNTGPGDPHLPFKEKRFWLHLAKLPHLGKNNERSKPLKMQFRNTLEVQRSSLSGLRHSSSLGCELPAIFWSWP